MTTPILIPCRECQLEFIIPAGQLLWECPACGTPHARPKSEGPTLESLKRATRLRLAGEFGEAEECYRQVLIAHDDEHDALWGRLLCRYGVKAVTEKRTGQRHLTVQRPHERPLQLHPDFKHACELAPEEIRIQYLTDAAYIDRAQALIRQKLADEAPWDIFLCHKTTELTGSGYTEDYNRAVQLYINLEKAGYQVFFAPYAGLLPGEAYEAGIYHALYTAKVMLLICSTPEHICSDWVQSEWMRYLEMMEDREDKHLIPLMYDSMPESSLPIEISARHLQSIRMQDWDWQERLMRAIRTHTGKAAGAEQKASEAVSEAVSADDAGYTAKVERMSSAQRAPESVQPEAEALVRLYAPESHFETSEVNGGMRIVRYTGPGGEVRIPPVIGGRRVLEIGDHAFHQCQARMKVVIPEGVTKICSFAFSECEGLESVSIPASAAEIEKLPIVSCKGLTSIVVAPDNPAYDSRDDVLVSKQGVLLVYPIGKEATSYEIPEGVTAIEACAFFMAVRLTSVQIPQSVKEIALMAFSKCESLKRVTLPKDVEIEFSAFERGPSLTLCVHEDSAAHKFAVSNQNTVELIEATRKDEPENHFQTVEVDGGVAIVSYTGPDTWGLLIPKEIGGKSVVEIREGAINENRSTVVGIPASVTRIAHLQFAACAHLKRFFVAVDNPVYCTNDGVLMTKQGRLICYPRGIDSQTYEIPETVTVIESSAFFNNDKLTDVKIPASVKQICMLAFAGCTGLRQVALPEEVSVSLGAFDQGPGLTLRVYEHSKAHQFALANGNRVELISSSTAFAPESYFSVTALGDTVNITQYTGPGGDVRIPPMIGGRKVVSIGGKAFEGCGKLTSVVIPVGVTMIGANAFLSCGQLTSVCVPSSVSAIAGNPFQFCSSLRSISVSPDNLFYLSCGDVLMSTMTGELVCYPAGLTAKAYAIPANIKRIVSCAFSGCKHLTSVTIPESVTSIGAFAFDSCSGLTEASIPASVTSIQSNPFPRCSGLQSITVASGNPNYEVRGHALLSKPGEMISYPPGLGQERYSVPEGVRSIGAAAFYQCAGLKQISVPEGVKIIADNAFFGCSALTLCVHEDSEAHQYAQKHQLRAALASSVPFKAKKAEAAAAAQPSPECPFQVKDVDGGVCVFHYTGEERALVIPATVDGKKVVAIGTLEYNQKKRLTEIEIPEGVTRIEPNALEGCDRLRRVHLPQSLTSIGRSAFEGCSRLTSVNLPEGITWIGARTFTDCRSLTSVHIPESVTKIDASAFFGCSSLTSIHIPGSVSSIGRAAFKGCYNLESVEISEGLREIKDDAFQSCTNLTGINLPKSITSFGDAVFVGCRQVIFAVYPNSAGYTFVKENNLRFKTLFQSGAPSFFARLRGKK